MTRIWAQIVVPIFTPFSLDVAISLGSTVFCNVDKRETLSLLILIKGVFGLQEGTLNVEDTWHDNSRIPAG